MPSLAKLLILTLIFAVTAQPALAQRYSGQVLRIGLFGGTWKDTTHETKGKVLEIATGARVEYVVGNPKDQLAKLVAAARGKAPPPLDVVELTDDGTHIMLREAGLLEKLDYSRLSNSRNVGDQFKTDYWVAFFIVTYGILYNTEKFKEAGLAPPRKYEDLLRAGVVERVSLPHITHTMGPFVLTALALSAGGSETNIMPGFQQLARVNVPDFYRATGELTSRLVAGDVWATAQTAGIAYRLRNEGAPIEYVNPIIGPKGEYAGLLGHNWQAIPKGARALDLAYIYINMSLDPKFQYEHAKLVGYGPTNRLIENTFLRDPVLSKLYPSRLEELSRMYRLNISVIARDFDKWLDIWNRTIGR